MLRYIILLCLLPFLANCWNDIAVDGPCPKPPKAEDESKWDKINGEWWLVKANRQILKDEPISCAEISIKKHKNNTIHLKVSVIAQDNKRHDVKKRLDPIKDKPGHWKVFVIDKNDKAKADGWIYTLVKIEDGGLLYYGCQKDGEKHKSFYHLLVSKDKKLSDQFKEKYGADFDQAYKDTKDEREVIAIPHKDCGK